MLQLNTNCKNTANSVRLQMEANKCLLTRHDMSNMAIYYMFPLTIDRVLFCTDIFVACLSSRFWS